MTVRAEIVTVRCKRLPQSTQCVTSGRYVRLIVCGYTFFFLMTFPCSLALSATLLSILSLQVGREYCPHGLGTHRGLPGCSEGGTIAPSSIAAPKRHQESSSPKKWSFQGYPVFPKRDTQQYPCFSVRIILL